MHLTQNNTVLIILSGFYCWSLALGVCQPSLLFVRLVVDTFILNIPFWNQMPFITFLVQLFWCYVLSNYAIIWKTPRWVRMNTDDLFAWNWIWKRTYQVPEVLLPRLQTFLIKFKMAMIPPKTSWSIPVSLINEFVLNIYLCICIVLPGCQSLNN